MLKPDMKQRYRNEKGMPAHKRPAWRFVGMFRKLTIGVTIAALVVLPTGIALTQQINPLVNSKYYGAPASATPSPNPPLVSQACLGDMHIALVADSSGSVYDVAGAPNQVLNAFSDFINVFLTGAPGNIKFSVSRFNSLNGNTAVLQGMTNDINALYKNGLNRLYPGGESYSTDWRLGLVAGASTFGSTPASTPKLIIFATDGDPKEPTVISTIGNPLNWAIGAANKIKQDNIRIVVIGVGDFNTPERRENLQKISGTNINSGGLNTDVLTTSFSNMSSALMKLSKSLCKEAGTGTGNGGTGSGNGGNGSGTGGNGSGTGNNGSGSGDSGNGTGNTGTGTGNNGSGNQGNGDGSGGNTNTGNGSGSGGTSQGTTAGSGQGDTGTGSGNNGGMVPNPTPAPAPSANTTGGLKVPAPTPEALGSQTIPPPTRPSIFFDGIEFTKGSASDNIVLANAVLIHRIWPYVAVIGAIVIACTGAGAYLWKRQHPIAIKAVNMLAKSKMVKRKTKRTKIAKPAKKK